MLQRVRRPPQIVLKEFIVAMTLSIKVKKCSLNVAHNTVGCTIQCKHLIPGATAEQCAANPFIYLAVDEAPSVTSTHTCPDHCLERKLRFFPFKDRRQSSPSQKHAESKEHTYTNICAVSLLCVDSSTAIDIRFFFDQ